MASPQERCITDPAQLQESDHAVSPGGAGETTQLATPRLRLVLLQPLVDCLCLEIRLEDVEETFELEGVVCCTSDGLVVVLRRVPVLGKGGIM